MMYAAHAPAKPVYWAMGLLLPLLLGAAWLAAVFGGQAWRAGQAPGVVAPGQMVNLCLSMRVTGGWRVAAWWGPAVSTRTGRLRRPFVQANMACGLVPWQTWLPSTGSLQTSD